MEIKLLKGDCLEVLKTFKENSIDSIVTDPPAFLLQSNGNGMMNKEWDGINNLWKYLWLNKNFVNFVENLLMHTLVETNITEQNIVQKNVNIKELKENKQNNAQSVVNNLSFLDVQKNNSVLLFASTKQYLLDILKELLGNLVNENPFLNGEKDNVSFVIPIILPTTENKNIVVKDVLISQLVKECRVKEISFTKMEIAKIRDAIVEMDGISLGNKFMKEIIGDVNFVELDAKEKNQNAHLKGYNATILYPSRSVNLMKNLTLLLYAQFATVYAKKMEVNLIQNFFEIIASECLRVLKPGGYALVWAIPRTSHWTTTAWENAGFEVKDILCHLQGQGFPKGQNIGKKLDKELGNKREVIGISKNEKDFKDLGKRVKEIEGIDKLSFGLIENAKRIDLEVTKGNTEYEDWNTSLKPSVEFWILLRKPLSEKTLVLNIIKWGTGGLNIRDCRIPHDEDISVNRIEKKLDTREQGWGFKAVSRDNKGRYPSNVLFSHSPDCKFKGYKEVESNSHYPNIKVTGFGSNYGGSSEYLAEGERIKKERIKDYKCSPNCPIRILNEQSGIRTSGSMKLHHKVGKTGENGYMPNYGIYGKYKARPFPIEVEASSGGASRFFINFEPFVYIPKASRSEKDLGITSKEAVIQKYVNNRRCKTCGYQEVSGSPCKCEHPDWEIIKTPRKAKNIHISVKPIALMEYLVKLISPPNGVVLDPFMGSGSTGVACAKLGFSFIGIEKEHEYFELAKERISYFNTQKRL